MFIYLKYIPIIALFATCTLPEKVSTKNYPFANDPHRPQIHFTPEANWMNDPNGMVYYKEVYHLFQYYRIVSRGPMQWGHAKSKIWSLEEKKVALYPMLGYSFVWKCGC